MQLNHAVDCAERFGLCLAVLHCLETAFALLSVWHGDALLMALILVRYLQHEHLQLLLCLVNTEKL